MTPEEAEELLVRAAVLRPGELEDVDTELKVQAALLVTGTVLHDDHPELQKWKGGEADTLRERVLQLQAIRDNVRDTFPTTGA